MQTETPINEPRLDSGRGATDVRARQEPLRRLYREKPEGARITDRARTVDGTALDPFHGRVAPGTQEDEVVLAFGIHRAVGGDHDLPNPGDLLAAALATCLDSTIRIIADRLGVELTFLEVRVEAEVDVRGTLMVDRTVPVGFQALRCHVDLAAAEGTDPALPPKLLAAAEASCINLDTLRNGVPVETSSSLPTAQAGEGAGG